MSEITIGIIVAIVVALILGIKVWIHRALTFKMDESVILNFLKESRGEFKFRNTEAITAETGISTNRVAMVCAKSKSIQRNSKEKESWCLK
jgi:hypothetical protein